jgi:hypothetical protein
MFWRHYKNLDHTRCDDQKNKTFLEEILMNLKRMMIGAAFLIGTTALMSLPGCYDSGPQSGADDLNGPSIAKVDGATTFVKGIFSNPKSKDINNWVDDGNDSLVDTNNVTASVDWANYRFTVDWLNNAPNGFCYAPGWSGAPEVVNYQITSFVNPEGGCSGLYGWLDSNDSTIPYTEFYICETVGTIEGPHNNDNDGLIGANTQTKPEYVGSYDVDGCTYDFYKHIRYNKPNPEGKDKFWQWIAVNRNVNPEKQPTSTVPNEVNLFPRLSGTISLKTHMNKWSSLVSKTITKVYWTTFTVEAWITPPKNKIDPKNAGIKMNPDGKGTQFPYTNGREEVKFTVKPLTMASENVNICYHGLAVPGHYVFYMNGTNLANSDAISLTDPSAIFTMYHVNMTYLTNVFTGSGPNGTDLFWKRYGEVMAFKNGGYFLTVDDLGNVKQGTVTDPALLTDAEKFVMDNNYGFYDLRSIKKNNYYRLSRNGNCLPVNLYGDYFIHYGAVLPPGSPPSYYCLNNNWSEKMLTVRDTSGYSSIYSQTYNSSWQSQQWRLEEINGGPPSPGAKVRFRNIWSGKYLTVTNNSDYADVKAQDLNTSWTSQVWVIDGDLSQSRFKNVWSGKYLTVTSQAENAAIKCQPLNNDWPSQIWRLQY